MSGTSWSRDWMIIPQPPHDLAELALVEEWNALPKNNIMRLVRSMRHRCQAVIAANGGNTRYWHCQFLLFGAILVIVKIFGVIKRELLLISLKFRPNRKSTHVNNNIPNLLWVVCVYVYIYIYILFFIYLFYFYFFSYGHCTSSN